MAEDLDAPLRGRRPAGRRPTIGRLLIAAVAAVALATAGFIAFTDDPLGGEPMATASIERRLAPPSETASASGAATPAATVPAAQGGVPVVSPGDPMPKSGPVIIRVPGAGPGRSPAPVSADLLEPSRHGPLPRIAADGRRPADLYARSAPGTAAGRPQVALLLTLPPAGGSADDLLRGLPPEITVAIGPDVPGLEQAVAAARARGHEVLLLAPAEGTEPARSSGALTLRGDAPAAVNLERLRAVMGRAAGYVGLALAGGAKFAAVEDAIFPVLTEAAHRGLLFVDTAAAPDGPAVALGASIGLLVARVELIVDAAAAAAEIDAELARLERSARERGGAVGAVSAGRLPTERIAAWAKELGGRGLELAPVSAIARASLARSEAARRIAAEPVRR